MSRYDKQADPELSSARWRRLRSAAMARDLWLCQDCLANWRRDPTQQVHPAVLVHHIRPRSAHPELTYDLDNLISLCCQHHEQRHPERRKTTTAPAAPEGIRVIKI